MADVNDVFVRYPSVVCCERTMWLVVTLYERVVTVGRTPTEFGKPSTSLVRRDHSSGFLDPVQSESLHSSSLARTRTNTFVSGRAVYTALARRINSEGTSI
jgi:hypothetical protein